MQMKSYSRNDDFIRTFSLTMIFLYLCISGAIRVNVWRLGRGRRAWMEAGDLGPHGASAVVPAAAASPLPCDTVTAHRK